MRILASALLVASTLALAGCIGGGGPPKPTKRQAAMIDRVLARAPGAAQPSTIVAVELAFSRAARERGQWTAFREFAAPDAKIHGAAGPFEAGPWLLAQTDPKEAVQWAPRVVVMSCDGALAVSKGRFRNPEARSAISSPYGSGRPMVHTAMFSMSAATTTRSPRPGHGPRRATSS